MEDVIYLVPQMDGKKTATDIVFGYSILALSPRCLRLPGFGFLLIGAIGGCMQVWN